MANPDGSPKGSGGGSHEALPLDMGATLPEQVARLILRSFLAQRMRWVGHRIAEMHIPLTLREIVETIGVSDHHAQHAVRELVEARAITIPDSGLRVVNPDILVDSANIDSKTLTQWLLR